MTTNQEARHQDLRDSTSTARGMTADWHALWDGASVADGTFNERLLAWINSELGTSYTNLPGAMHAYAANGGFANWHSINVIESGPSYAVNNNEPDTVADFAGVLNSGTEYYRVGGTETTFDSMFTHTGASNKVMRDSDGNLKWAPHNVALYSDDITNAAWSKSTSTSATDADTFDFSGDTTNGRIAQSISSPIIGAEYTFEFQMKAGTAGSVTARMVHSTGTGTTLTCNLTTDWQTFTLSFVTPSGSTGLTVYPVDCRVGAPTGGITSVDVRNIRVYRSDLGGMVNNPDRGDSYVPTTSAARYLPRRNHYRYNGTSYTKKGLLLESAAATNLITRSQDFADLSYTAVRVAALSADATGPDGTTSAFTLTDAGGGGAQTTYIQVSTTVATSTAYTFSFFAKADQLSWCSVGVVNFTTPATAIQYFDLGNGLVGTAASGLTARIEGVGNGWYRCSVTFTTDASDTSGQLQIYVANSQGDASVDQDGTSSILIYGAQFEAGSVPTSYIPTSGATATRAAETLTIAGSNMATSTTAMSFHMQGEYNFADNNSGAEGQWLRWRADANNYIEERLATNTATANHGNLVSIQTAAATVDTVTSPSDSFLAGVNTPYNWATRHTASAMNLAVAGTAATENSTPVALSDLSAASCELGLTYRGTIALFRQWDVDLTDAGIEEATS